MNVFDQLQLRNRVAVVTGAGSGLGWAFAEGLAEAGALVACVDIDLEAANRAKERVERQGGRALAVQTDVADEGQVMTAFERIEQYFGGIDIVFANAGIGGKAPKLPDLSLEYWNRVIAVNQTSVFLTVRESARRMMNKGAGKIIVTASIGGLVGEPELNSFAYSAAKGAVINMTRAAALQLAPYNIQVNAIAPGMFLTNLGGGRLNSETAATDSAVAELRERLLHKIPLGRFAIPDELKGLAIYLASAASNYTTGAIFVVDGGMTAQ